MKADGCYYIDGDKKAPRVTSVLERWYDPSAAAATWVAQEAVRLTDMAKSGEPARVTEFVWNGEKYEWAFVEKDPLELLSDAKWLTGAYWRGKQAAMDRGTLTNEFVDEWAAGMRITADDVPEWVHQRFECGKMMEGATVPTPWKADMTDVEVHACCALKFLSEKAPDIRATQIKVWSDDPLYAGTADACGSMSDKVRCFEFKTGQPNRSHALQVCAYTVPLEKALGLDLVPTVVYFSHERYRVVEIEKRSECLEAFYRNLKDFEFAKDKTPWENKDSVRLDESDLPFVSIR